MVFLGERDWDIWKWRPWLRAMVFCCAALSCGAGVLTQLLPSPCSGEKRGIPQLPVSPPTISHSQYSGAVFSESQFPVGNCIGYRSFSTRDGSSHPQGTHLEMSGISFDCHNLEGAYWHFVVFWPVLLLNILQCIEQTHNKELSYKKMVRRVML